MKPLTTLLLAVAALLSGGTAIAQGDAEAGKQKAFTCTGCHGVTGYKNAYPSYRVPKIAGQNYEYLVAALTAYRKGEREHPTMQAQAQGYSEQDIQDIATYLSSQGKQP